MFDIDKVEVKVLNTTRSGMINYRVSYDGKPIFTNYFIFSYSLIKIINKIAQAEKLNNKEEIEYLGGLYFDKVVGEDNIFLIEKLLEEEGIEENDDEPFIYLITAVSVLQKITETCISDVSKISGVGEKK